MTTTLSLMLLLHAKNSPGIALNIPANQAVSECPFKMTDHAMIVNATINGRNVSLMFDTGFGGWTVLDSSLNIGKPDGKINLQDFVGTFQADTVKIKSFKLGTQSIPVDESSTSVMSSTGGYSESYGTHCDGIMGLQVIQNTITEINFEKGKFIFYPKSFDISKRIPDNKKTFLTNLLPAGVNAMEMRVKTEAGKSMILALDTGNSFYATTHRDVLDRVGIWPISKKPSFTTMASVASGPVESWYVRMPKLSIFGVPVQSSVWSIIDLPAGAADSDGTIGFGFLKNFNIIIDYERRRVWLENFTGKVTDDEPAATGMSVYWDVAKKNYLVVRVQENSPSAKAGIKRGDILLSIDGNECLNVGFDRMKDKLEGKSGSKVKLAMSRLGELYRVEIERVPLINDPKD